MEEYWVYILETKKGTLYTGYTTDIGKRYQEHIRGTVKCKYTRSFGVKVLRQAWRIWRTRKTQKLIDSKEAELKGVALKIENFIKRQNKVCKENIIKNPNNFIKIIATRYDANYNIMVISGDVLKKINSGIYCV